MKINGYAPISDKDRAMIIGVILKSLREEKKLTQQEVSDGIGIKKQTYANYEYGRNDPSTETLIQLAYFHDVSMDVITGKALSKPNLGDIQHFLNQQSSPISEDDSEEMRKLKEENENYKNIFKVLSIVSGSIQEHAQKDPGLVSQIINEEIKKANENNK